MAKNISGFYVVRDAKGGYVGTFRASSAQAAINAFIQSQRVYGSIFKGQSIRNFTGYTASIEAPEKCGAGS